jgi:hypothetical protein
LSPSRLYSDKFHNQFFREEWVVTIKYEDSPSSFRALLHLVNLVKFFTKCFQNNVQKQGLNSSPLHYRSHDRRACTLYHLSQMVIIMDNLKCYLLDSYY